MSYENRSKNNNQFKIGHAWPGLCSLCFDEVAYFNGSNENGKPNVVRYKNSARVFKIALSDDSTMATVLCRDCYENINEDDYGQLMSSEKSGWNRELDVCLKDKWSKKRKEKYRKKYMKLKIKKKKKVKGKRNGSNN